MTEPTDSANAVAHVEAMAESREGLRDAYAPLSRLMVHEDRQDRLDKWRAELADIRRARAQLQRCVRACNAIEGSLDKGLRKTRRRFFA